jgi:hypothetical protein
MRFDMMDCNSMATPMETNLKNLSDYSSESTMSHYLVEAKEVPLGYSEACVEVLAGYSWI